MNARQAAKMWKRKYESLGREHVKVIVKTLDVKDVGYTMDFTREEWEKIKTNNEYWEYLLDQAAIELGEAALKSCLWRATQDRDSGMVHIWIRTKFNDFGKPGINDIGEVCEDIKRWDKNTYEY